MQLRDNISNVTFVLFLVINKDFLYLEQEKCVGSDYKKLF